MKILERVWYLFLIALYSIAYFFWAILAGLWGWIKK